MPAGKNDTTGRELMITRLLDAPIDLVWEVWTDPEHIVNWWGPHDFKNTIHSMEVKPGGEWQLTMHGPDGTDYRNRSVFREIIPHEKIVFDHVTGPKYTATINFEARGEKTHISWHMLFESQEQFIQVVKTFKADEGLKQNIDKLNIYIKAKFTVRKQLQVNNTARVCSYLNFAGNTEEAFTFYRKVFRSEFAGGKIQRFGDFPPFEGQPPLSENDKNLVLHVELPILGGHTLMATDAPESLGFKISRGNNMHIQLEPGTRAEADRLFKELSEEGNIEMPMQDMFFGAYFGSFTDRFGINWMINYSAQKH